MFTKYLTPKNFNIKPEVIRFSSTRYMSDLEKASIYISFVKFLNNHFKDTLFVKKLYEHLHLHCGFIAHYNIHGFYGEYFTTAAKYHMVVNNHKMKLNEYVGFIAKPDITRGESFYNMFAELNAMSEGLGEFFSHILSNSSMGGYREYEDLNEAMKRAFRSYMDIFIQNIEKAKAEHSKTIEREEQKQRHELTKKVKEIANSDNIHIVGIPKLNEEKKGQTSLFDFM